MRTLNNEVQKADQEYIIVIANLLGHDSFGGDAYNVLVELTRAQPAAIETLSSIINTHHHIRVRALIARILSQITHSSAQIVTVLQKVRSKDDSWWVRLEATIALVKHSTVFDKAALTDVLTYLNDSVEFTRRNAQEASMHYYDSTKQVDEFFTALALVKLFKVVSIHASRLIGIYQNKYYSWECGEDHCADLRRALCQLEIEKPDEAPPTLPFVCLSNSSTHLSVMPFHDYFCSEDSLKKLDPSMSIE